MNVVEEIKGKQILHWFRKDLRPIEHEILSNHCSAESITCFYIYDDKYNHLDPLGFPYFSEKRKQFLEETLTDLENALAKLDIKLLRFENFNALFKFNFPDFDLLTFQKQHGTEEKEQEQKVRDFFQVKTLTFNSFTLLSENNLPFNINSTPFTFTPFRKKVEKYGTFQEPVYSINIAAYTGPAHFFKGGFSAALNRLNYYTYQSQLVSSYKETRNGLLGTDFSSRFSPWLALGAISPRLIYAVIKSYEAEFGSNQSTYWLVFELLWRDFFQFQLMKYGSKFFHRHGIKQHEINSRQNEKVFWSWANGETNDAFVNANMNELNETGWMSNRGRQNVASYLVHDLNIDWRWGASYFESKLIDYDVASNWGNWMYIAGVGNDPRPSRKFNTQKQAERYDPNQAYIRKWS